MDQAELSLATSMHALVHHQNAIANNLANVASSSFKRQAGTFEPFELLLGREQDSQLSVPRYVERTDFTQGDVNYTGDHLNLALEGDGLLRVRDPRFPNETILTRNGQLGVDPGGLLTVGGKLHVLDQEGQPITIGDRPEFRITANGEITDPIDGTQLGTLGRFRVEQRGGLESLGSGLYRHRPQAGKLTEDAFTHVRQNHLESSNTSSISEMVSMISVQRQFEAVTKALSAVESTTDQLNQLAQG